MKITKRTIILGCLGITALSCCLFVAFVFYVVSTMKWGTELKNNMHDPEFRQGIEKWLGVVFPPSAEWERSEYHAWLDADFQCVFTLPQKDVDVMFPPENVTWHENDYDMLNRHPVADWRAWLKGKKLDHFKVMRYEPESGSHPMVVVENPPGINENERVWVYIVCFDT